MLRGKVQSFAHSQRTPHLPLRSIGTAVHLSRSSYKLIINDLQPYEPEKKYWYIEVQKLQRFRNYSNLFDNKRTLSDRWRRVGLGHLANFVTQKLVESCVKPAHFIDAHVNRLFPSHIACRTTEKKPCRHLRNQPMNSSICNVQ